MKGYQLIKYVQWIPFVLGFILKISECSLGEYSPRGWLSLKSSFFKFHMRWRQLFALLLTVRAIYLNYFIISWLLELMEQTLPRIPPIWPHTWSVNSTTHWLYTLLVTSHFKWTCYLDYLAISYQSPFFKVLSRDSHEDSYENCSLKNAKNIYWGIIYLFNSVQFGTVWGDSWLNYSNPLVAFISINITYFNL